MELPWKSGHSGRDRAPGSLLLLLPTQLYREFIFINTLKLSGEEGRVDMPAGSLPREGIRFRAGAGEAAVPEGPSPALGSSPSSLHD